ncbi:GAF domain-containing hybrid sensor histidine kinase/response regulator [Hymenobacter sp. DG01]|uniref:GAF domain-containing hybrid sensor histidine kinase/response regulator n=1 Tax=Hymenobacter sp. DG01 TaxID=2584940 RepID=UPI0011239C78|nr:GAF domain-containing hybrid sensor histidine kinase/response regulator [Hymenobacter sp. DG01]
MESLLTGHQHSLPFPAAAIGWGAPWPAPDALAALQALHILDSESEPAYDALVREAAQLCAAPMASISFLDAERQWVKAQTGLPGLLELPRSVSFCAHALGADSLLELHQAHSPGVFARNPLAGEQLGVVFYAGYPIRTAEGHAVGVLAVYDTAPRSLSPEQQTVLRLLARQVSQELALRQAQLARQAAEAASQRKQVFLAAVSHEIRTPLHGIMGLTRLLRESFITPQQEEHLTIILSSAENLLTVINDILDFSKVELGRMELERVPFDVAATVRDATRSLQHLAQSKGLALHTHIQDSAIPTVEGDPFRLRQVLLNLLTNALKFTEAGHISVTVDVAAEDARQVQLNFCVEDTGVGISPEKAQEVFRAFDQAATSTARRYGGTGLGLAICKSLIELQQGRIWLESQPGRGSCFRFSLAYPVSAYAPPTEDVLPVLAPGLLQGLSVLLAEDNSVNKLLATTLLQGWGLEVEVATNGRQALDLAEAQPYDLILMDIQMPQLTGFEATAYLRATTNPNRHTPIIALTANALKDEVGAYTRQGFTDYLIKPYSEAELYRVLVRATGRTEVAPELPRPSYNFSQLGRLAHDQEFIRKMQQLFLDTVPEQLRQLREALSKRRWKAASLLTHSLRATYGSLQMAEAMHCLKQLEKAMHPPPPTPQPLLNLLGLLTTITNRMADTFAEHLRQQAEAADSTTVTAHLLPDNTPEEALVSI